MKRPKLPKPNARYANQIAKVRDALIADPLKTNSQIVTEAHSSTLVVARERRHLVKAGMIAETGRERRARAYQKRKPKWEMPGKQLIKTCATFDMFLDYCIDVMRAMPDDCDKAFTNPATEQEKRLRWGFIQALRNIQKMTEALEEKYTEPRLVAKRADE